MSPDDPAGPPLDPDQIGQLEAALGRAARDRLLQMVLDHAPRAEAAIRSAAAEGRWDAARREAHGLRGAIGSLGAAPLMAVLQRIEHAGDGEPVPQALGREVERLVAAARALLAD